MAFLNFQGRLVPPGYLGGNRLVSPRSPGLCWTREGSCSWGSALNFGRKSSAYGPLNLNKKQERMTVREMEHHPLVLCHTNPSSTHKRVSSPASRGQPIWLAPQMWVIWKGSPHSPEQTRISFQPFLHPLSFSKMKINLAALLNSQVQWGCKIKVEADFMFSVLPIQLSCLSLSEDTKINATETPQFRRCYGPT